MTETNPTSPVTSTRVGEEMIQAIFDAIAAATRIDNDPDGWHRIVIDAAKFIEVFNSHCDRKLCTSLVEPSLLGRETVREALESWLAEQIAQAASQQAQSYSMAGEYGQRQGERWHARQVALYETKLKLDSLSPLKE